MMLTETVMAYRQDNPGIRVNIFPKRYWTPFGPPAPDDKGDRATPNAQQPCQEREKCLVEFPQAIAISHWAGSWEVDCSSDNEYCPKSMQRLCSEECCPP